MDVFVTGATGYIGRVVAEKLQAAGHRVVGLARSDHAATRLRDRGITPHRGDLFDVASLTRAARAADGVIHLGATLGPDWAEGDRAAVAAILGTLDGSGKPFVYTSGTTVYGDTGTAFADEDSPLNPPGFWAWRPPIERDVLAAMDRNIRGVVLRPPTVYGRGEGASLQLLVQTSQQAGVAPYIGTGTNRHSTVHVDDLAALYVLALERAPAGTLLNAAAGASVSMEELAMAVSYAIGRAGVIAPWTIDDACAALGGRANFFAMNHQISGARATLLLGWNPRAPSLLYDVAHGSYRIQSSA